MRQAYTLDDVPEAERLESALRLGKAVDEWRAQLPSLMSAIKPSLLHLTWRRQQNLLQLAHYHAQMLVYRPFLTAPYPTDREKKQTADLAIRTCIEAARVTLTITVNLAREQAERDKSHFHTLLHPHHLIYMAVSILFLVPLVRDRQKLLPGGIHHNYKPETDAKLTELANKAVKALSKALTNTHPHGDGLSSSRSCRKKRSANSTMIRPRATSKPMRPVPVTLKPSTSSSLRMRCVPIGKPTLLAKPWVVGLITAAPPQVLSLALFHGYGAGGRPQIG